MRAGRLRHRPTIQRATRAADSFGDVVPSWSDVATIWGSVTPASMAEVIGGGQIEPIGTHNIRIRHYAGLLSTDRFKHGDDHYNVVSVLDRDKRGIYQDVLVKQAEQQ